MTKPALQDVWNILSSFSASSIKCVTHLLFVAKTCWGKWFLEHVWIWKLPSAPSSWIKVWLIRTNLSILNWNGRESLFLEGWWSLCSSWFCYSLSSWHSQRSDFSNTSFQHMSRLTTSQSVINVSLNSNELISNIFKSHFSTPASILLISLTRSRSFWWISLASNIAWLIIVFSFPHLWRWSTSWR